MQGLIDSKNGYPREALSLRSEWVNGDIKKPPALAEGFR